VRYRDDEPRWLCEAALPPPAFAGASDTAISSVCPRAAAYFNGAAGGKNRKAKRTRNSDIDAGYRKQTKASRRCDARDAREALSARADALHLASLPDFVVPTAKAVLAHADARVDALVDALENDHARSRFWRWRSRLLAGWSLLLHGFGSKRRLLERFADEALASVGDVVVIDGFDGECELRLELLRAARDLEIRLPPPADGDRASASGVARRLVAAANERPGDARVVFVVHTVDGRRLRSPDAVEAITSLRSDRTHLVASCDHVNAPLLWSDADHVRANWLPTDATTFAWYDAEAPKAAVIPDPAAAKNSAKPLLDTSGLSFVLMSLTPRHVEILKLLATAQRRRASGRPTCASARRTRTSRTGCSSRTSRRSAATK